MHNLEGHEPLDQAIDRAVRSIMSADTRPAFRRRVLGRIEPGWRLGAWMRWQAAAAAIVVCGLAGLIVYSVGSRSAAPAPQTVAAPPATPGPSPAAPRVDSPATAAALPETVTPAPRPAQVNASTRRSTRARSEALFGPRSERVSAASITAPVATEPIVEPPAATPAPSGITPMMAPAAIVIPPIEIPPIRVHRPDRSH